MPALLDPIAVYRINYWVVCSVKIGNITREMVIRSSANMKDLVKKGAYIPKKFKY